MAAVDLKRLVLIEAMFASAGGGPRYVFGTGYFLTNDLILTAGHVVAADEPTSIEVRVEKKSGKKRWREAHIIWHHDGLDAALLKVAEPLSDIDLPPIRSEPFRENVAWESLGYPAAAVKGEAREREHKTSGLSGDLYAQGGGGQGMRELDLGVNDAAKGAAWQGVSGAPVFVDNKLVGLIKTCPTDFDGGRLLGVPIDHLFADSGFRLAISPPWLEPFPQQSWCLVLASEADTEGDVEETVGAVLANGIADTAGVRFDKKATKVVAVNEVLEGPGRWLQFVRALCAAPVMIADVSEFEPAIMLLLGIRAVVRRGVTVAVTRSRVGDEEWKDLPFNIQEIKLIQLETGFDIQHPNHPVQLIGDAIEDGLAEVTDRSDYLDLPVYDAVRCPEPQDRAGGNTLAESALVLCSFQKEYAEHWRFVSDKLVKTRHTAEYTPRKFLRMRDIASPRLVGKTLYEHIRWTHCCIVDWTHWRPNVFFEFGARLACSDLDPISLIDRREAIAARKESRDGQRSRLLALLVPEQYKLSGPSLPFKISFAKYSGRMLGESHSAARTAIASGATYRVALEAYDWKNNWVIAAPHEEMRAAAEALLVVDQKEGGSRVLFASNPEFSKQLMSNVRERWIAAWYYFLNRHNLDEIESDDDLMNALSDLGEMTQQWLVRSKDPHHQRIYREIGDTLMGLEGDE